MEYEMQPYIVYVSLDERNLIAAVNSSAFLSDVTRWTEIDRGYTQRHHHAQGNYFQKQIYDDRGIKRYKLKDGIVVERTQEEMDADYTEPEARPTQEDRIAALEEELKAAKILLGVE